MLKAADAFHEAGYRVRMISTRTTDWATATDREIAATRGWSWRVVNYGRGEAMATWLRSGARYKAARAFASLVTSVPQSVATAAFARVHRELVDAILEEPADLIYGGTTGAIAAVAEAGRRSGTAFAVDFEDFHCAEHASPEGDLSNTLGGLVMRWSSAGAAFVTAGSAAIARACQEDLGIASIPINNVFPLPASAPDRTGRPDRRHALSVYWFSQTVGPTRGLEDIVRALGATARPASLTLRGCALPGYMEALGALAANAAPRLDLQHLPPVSPLQMIDECRPFDLGVSAEQGTVRNRVLSLPNKATTYPLAGLPVALTDTQGQRPLVDGLGRGALVFSPGDHEGLASQLLQLMTDRERLAEAGDASWQAARRRWHWEHDLERGALLAAAATAVGGATA
jgi:hypothetical protein